MVEKQDFEAMIVRYLNGDATPDEAMMLEDWKNESPENQQLFNHYEKLLLGAVKFEKPNTDQAWREVSRAAKADTKVIPLARWVQWGSAIAAVLVIGFFAITYQFKSSSGGAFKAYSLEVPVENEHILFAKNGLRNFTLTDNSIVELREGSSLELSKDFAKGERRAKLNGSGKFTVVHDESHPFVIDVEGLEVYDIGTVFDIQTLEDTVKVIVYEGAVELRLNDQTLAMEAGDSAFYVISEQLIDSYKTQDDRKDVVFNFEETSLKDVVQVLEEFFNRKIVIVSDSVKECLVTVSFDQNNSLAEILDIIALTLDLEIISKSNKIEIYGKGC